MLNLDLLKGTFSLLLLKAVALKPRHGHEIMNWIRQHSDETFLVEEGAIYPALHRLESRDLLEAEWGMSDNNRKAKYYRLTPKGRSRLKVEHKQWQLYVETFNRLLAAT
jgi:transcriptional regulator